MLRLALENSSARMGIKFLIGFKIGEAYFQKENCLRIVIEASSVRA